MGFCHLSQRFMNENSTMKLQKTGSNNLSVLGEIHTLIKWVCSCMTALAENVAQIKFKHIENYRISLAFRRKKIQFSTHGKRGAWYLRKIPYGFREPLRKNGSLNGMFNLSQWWFGNNNWACQLENAKEKGWGKN